VSGDHPNLTLARRLWSATAKADSTTIHELLADDVVWRASGENPLSGDYHGPEGVVRYLTLVAETADEVRSDLETIFYNDDGAVLAYKVYASRGPHELKMEILLVLHVTGGRITRALSVPVDQSANDDFWT
jgi:ketosteroid isomerase-like protein